MVKAGIKVSKTTEKKIVDDYSSGMSVREVAERHDVNFGSVGRILRRCGIEPRRQGTPRRYALNEHYFDVIDSPDKAYFLGLLFADGCNARYNKGKGCFSNEIRLELTHSDKPILDAFVLFVKYSGKPIRVDRSKYSFNGHPIQDTYKVVLNSKHMSKRLEDIGMVQAKTHILKPPSIGTEFVRDFIRGYFDGDGGISIAKKSIYISMLGTRSICEFISDIIYEETDVKMYIYPHQLSENKFYVRVNGVENAKRVLSWLYENDNGLHITRKYLSFLNLEK